MRSLAVVVASLGLLAAGAGDSEAKPKTTATKSGASADAKRRSKPAGSKRRDDTEKPAAKTAKTAKTAKKSRAGGETAKRPAKNGRDGGETAPKSGKQVATADTTTKGRDGTDTSKKGAADAATKSAKADSHKHARAASPTERAVKPERGRKPRKKKWTPPASLGPASGQSVGLPWYGRLQDPATLPESPRYVIRRPGRAFGTKPTVAITKSVLDSILDDFPEAHPLAVGDMSALHGGQISQHRSHQSGRDLDLGLFFKTKPTSYPSDFVSAAPDTLDFLTTFSLLDAFADSALEDGGVQMMFLDYTLQGMLYEWAKVHQVEVEHLDMLFQYPHGKGTAHGLIRHEPNHDNHVHIRFKCPTTDTGCKS